MRAKVPQDVQRADTIIGPITAKQLVALMISGGISYLFYGGGGGNAPEHSSIELLLIWSPLIITAAFCFIKFKGLSLSKILLLTIEKFFRPSIRFWQSNTTPYVSITWNKKENKQKEEEIKDQEPSNEKLLKLVEVLEGEKIKMNK